MEKVLAVKNQKVISTTQDACGRCTNILNIIKRHFLPSGNSYWLT